MHKAESIRKSNRVAKAITGIPHPFLKWAGGKRQLLPQIDSYLPQEFRTYIEPFVGGGALFFYLLPDRAFLIDNNSILIEAYDVIKNDVEALIAALQGHKNEAEYYYKLRDIDRDPSFDHWTPVQRVARTIYLNRCCYNGLYRVNSQGYFNVPFGKYNNPKFCDPENLRAVHDVLQGVQLIADSFDRCLDLASKDDFIYFDPPYQPLSKTANFTGYTKESFGTADQQRLKKVMDELSHRGCKVLISNSDTPYIRELYNAYEIKAVKAIRAINSDATKRGAISEVLVTNYSQEK